MTSNPLPATGVRPAVRLPPTEIAAIKAAVAEVFGPEARVRLFGSRARLDLRGGDVDILIEGPPERSDFHHEAKLAGLLDIALDGRKVDIILLGFGEPTAPIHDIALRDGVLL